MTPPLDYVLYVTLQLVCLQEGLFTVAPLELEGEAAAAAAGAVRHALVCSSAHGASDGATHLEVVKQASISSPGVLTRYGVDGEDVLSQACLRVTMKMVLRLINLADPSVTQAAWMCRASGWPSAPPRQAIASCRPASAARAWCSTTTMLGPGSSGSWLRRRGHGWMGLLGHTPRWFSNTAACLRCIGSLCSHVRPLLCIIYAFHSRVSAVTLAAPAACYVY